MWGHDSLLVHLASLSTLFPVHLCRNRTMNDLHAGLVLCANLPKFPPEGPKPMRQKWSFQHSHSWSRWSVTSLKINEGSFCWASKTTGNTSSHWTPLWSHDQEGSAYSTAPAHPPKKCLTREITILLFFLLKYNRPLRLEKAATDCASSSSSVWHSQLEHNRPAKKHVTQLLKTPFFVNQM